MNFARIPQLHHGLAGVGVGPSPPPHHRAPDRSSVGVARTAASADGVNCGVATWGFLACCNWLVQVEYLNLQAHAQALAKVLYTL